MEKTPWTNRLNFAMLTAWLLLSLTLALISFLWFGVDFRGYYAAARVLLAGGNPYDYRLVSQVLLEVTGEMGNNPFYYPPWYTWLFIPLAYLPFQVARALWMTFNLVIWIIGLWQVGKLFDWPEQGWKRYSLFALATFSFAWITWRYEQAGVLIFAILSAFILSMRNQSWGKSGIWLALLLIKPNVTLIVVFGISLWLLRKGLWRTVLVMVLTLVVLLSISTMITPDWFQPFFEEGFAQGLTVALDGPDQVVAVRINTTFLDWMRTLGVDPPWNMLFYAIAICIGLFVFFWSVYRSESTIDLVSLLLLVSYAITPYALQYDYPPLVLSLFWALSWCTSSPKTFTIGFLLTGFIFSVIFWQQNISWAYWMIIGLAVLMIWGGSRKTVVSSNIDKKTASP